MTSRILVLIIYKKIFYKRLVRKNRIGLFNLIGLLNNLNKKKLNFK